ncbi:MAG TPA: SLC13 family permease [Trueperaceae bacterium]
MSLAAIITIGTAVAIIGSLVFTRMAPDLAFGGGLVLLLVTGVLEPAEAFAGFANEGVLTVGALYAVVAGLRDTGGVHWISRKVLGRPKSQTSAMLRLMTPVAGLSAFLNNTPIVAMLIPAVRDWARQNDLAPSRLMIPLSYAAILGGTITLIGTSTNLVVNGLLLAAGEGRLGMFTLAWVGVPTAIVGILFILVARSLLPDRRSAMTRIGDPREYSVEMTVLGDGPLVGKSIEEAGLRHLPHVFLVEIEREGRLITAVSPQETLQAGDRLVFVGVVDSVVELQRIQGLSPATEQIFKLDARPSQRILIEAVVSNSFPMLGRRIRETRFRALYGAVVIAVARNGERLRAKIGDIIPRPGDTLLLAARPDFVERHRNSRDFYLVSPIEDSAPLNFERAVPALVILAGMVTVVTLGILPMVEAALLAAVLMIAFRCTSTTSARRSIDWQVLLVIASAFGLGVAMEKTGVAASVATGLLDLFGTDPLAALAVVYFVTAFFTNLITNNAAAVLMFPIALGVARALGVDFMPFAIAIAMAASASFATPIGYQTNLMVYGPGGYNYRDYFKIGVPLNIVTGLVALLVIPMVWGF